MAPFLWIVYPVLGFTIIVAFIGTVMVMRQLPLHVFAEILIGFVPVISSFFLGLILERIVSNFRLYRILRTLCRWAFSVVFTSALLATGDLRTARFENVPPGAWIAAFVVAFIVHHVFKRMDRLYFPVASEIAKEQELAAKGLRPKRHIIKRFMYSLLWLPIVMAAVNLGIRLVVELFTPGPSWTDEFYQNFSTVIYVIDVVLWLLLCIFGRPPGPPNTWAEEKRPPRHGLVLNDHHRRARRVEGPGSMKIDPFQQKPRLNYCLVSHWSIVSRRCRYA